MESRTKTCRSCGVAKHLDAFRKHPDCKDGVAARCKECVRVKDEAYREANRDKVAESQRRYVANNRKKFEQGAAIPESKVCGVCLVRKTSDKFTRHPAQKDGLSSCCKDCKKTYDASYRPKNAKRFLPRRRRYYSEHRSQWAEYARKEGVRVRINARMRVHNKKKRREDPEFKLVENLRSRLHGALNGRSKSAPTLELLGCSVAVAKWFLEQQFCPDPDTGEMMTWDNHGPRGWHVDHIVPFDAVDMADPSQQRRVCHVSNLQPLWWRENLSKGHRVDWAHGDGRYLLEQLAGVTS